MSDTNQEQLDVERSLAFEKIRRLHTGQIELASRGNYDDANALLAEERELRARFNITECPTCNQPRASLPTAPWQAAIDIASGVKNERDLGGLFEAGFTAARTKILDALIEQRDSVPAVQGEAAALKLTRDNGSWIPEVLDQVLVANFCGVSGHFLFQNNGGNCLMCQCESRLQTEAREAAIQENPDYQQGVEDALRIAIPIAKCSCADKIVEALQKHRQKARAATPSTPVEIRGLSPQVETQINAIWERKRDNFRDLGNEEWRGQYARDIDALVGVINSLMAPTPAPDAGDYASAKQDHAYATGFMAGLKLATNEEQSRVHWTTSGVQYDDYSEQYKQQLAAIERQRAEALKVMKTPAPAPDKREEQAVWSDTINQELIALDSRIGDAIHRAAEKIAQLELPTRDLVDQVEQIIQGELGDRF